MIEGFIYRAYGKGGELLYIGATQNATARLSTHRGGAEWFPYMREYTVRRYDSVSHAFEVEARAIKLLNPEYNIAGTAFEIGRRQSMKIWREEQSSRDTAKEIERLKEEMQAEYDAMTAEQKDAFLDSLGWDGQRPVVDLHGTKKEGHPNG